jgi:hypothetical protein
MESVLQVNPLISTIAGNCDISDARDHGIYTMCTMVLKLRNLFKWERGLEPWDEPPAAELLDWIETKENFWAAVGDRAYLPLTVAGCEYQPFDVEGINRALVGSGLYYGAGYGRALKAVFFLAEIKAQRTIESCPVLILGRELAREMAAPFAMLQDGVILVRRELLRFFFWDQLLEVRSSCRKSLHVALGEYGVFVDGVLDKERLRQALDAIVDGETDLFVYHEIGEMLETTLSGHALHTLVQRFPGSALEFVGRAVKDVLADTHPCGLLAYVCRERRQSSLAFYLSFFDGLRQKLFPEISGAWQRLQQDGGWQHVEDARLAARERLVAVAGHLNELADLVDHQPDENVLERFSTLVLVPLGLDQDQGQR